MMDKILLVNNPVETGMYTKIESELRNLMCLEKRSLIKKWAVQIREKVLHRNLEWFKPLLKHPQGARGV